MSNCGSFCLDSGVGTIPTTQMITQSQEVSKKRKRNVEDEEKRKEINNILKRMGIGVPMF